MRFRLIVSILGAICIAVCLLRYSMKESTEMIYRDSNEDIVLTVNKESISSVGLTLNIENVSGNTIYLEPWYRLERLVDENWEMVDPLSGVCWIQDDWRMAIYTNTQESNEYFWKWYYGEQPSGDYRIIVSILIRNQDGTDSLHPYKFITTFSIT